MRAAALILFILTISALVAWLRSRARKAVWISDDELAAEREWLAQMAEAGPMQGRG